MIAFFSILPCFHFLSVYFFYLLFIIHITLSFLIWLNVSLDFNIFHSNKRLLFSSLINQLHFPGCTFVFLSDVIRAQTDYKRWSAFIFKPSIAVQILDDMVAFYITRMPQRRHEGINSPVRTGMNSRADCAFYASYGKHYRRMKTLNSNCPVGWGCRIHRLLLCRGVRPPTSVLDMTLNCLMVRFQQYWSFVECGVPLHCHRSQINKPGLVALDKDPIYGLNRTNSILMLNWIVWVNWIAWNKNIFDN